MNLYFGGDMTIVNRFIFQNVKKNNMQQYIQTFRIVLAIALTAFIMWLWNDREFQKNEKIRQAENFRQTQMFDSLRYSQYSMRPDEIENHLQYKDPELLNKLENNSIKVSRIESIISHYLKYQDDTLRSTDITRIVSAVRNNIPATMPFKDSTGCLKISGKIRYENDSLKLDISSREFNGKTQAVAYTERKQWQFWFIKSRFLGKKQMTAKVFDECGNSQVVKIEKKKD